MSMTRKALREKIKSQTDAIHLAYKKYKQGIYLAYKKYKQGIYSKNEYLIFRVQAKNEYELEIERLDTLFDASFEEKVN